MCDVHHAQCPERGALLESAHPLGPEVPKLRQGLASLGLRPHHLQRHQRLVYRLQHIPSSAAAILYVAAEYAQQRAEGRDGNGLGDSAGGPAAGVLRHILLPLPVAHTQGCYWRDQQGGLCAHRAYILHGLRHACNDGARPLRHVALLAHADAVCLRTEAETWQRTEYVADDSAVLYDCRRVA